MRTLLEELRELEAELHHPGRICSRERLEQLLHPDFHEVGRSGRAYTRQMVIAHLCSQSETPPVRAEGHAVQLLAEGCALLSFRSALWTVDGQPIEAALRSSVWLKTALGWQLVYHQGTPAQSPLP